MNRRIVVVAHNIRSLWNVGSFFRTADAFAIEHVYLTGYTPSPPRKEISKTAIGADEWIPWSTSENVLVLLAKLQSEGFSVVSLELSPRSRTLSTVLLPLTTPVCIVVGNEILGVPEDVLAVSDIVASIPMLGKKHSLNVSVALGIALYHVRQS